MRPQPGCQVKEVDTRAMYLVNGCLQERRIVYMCSLLWGGPAADSIRGFCASIGSEQGKTATFPSPAAV
jgi:hypothetical protein